jgi:hypothetical protein
MDGFRQCFQSSPPVHSMVGGAVEQFSAQVCSGLQYHCSDPRLMQEPAQCLCGMSTGSIKVALASVARVEGSAAAVERTPAMESITNTDRRIIELCHHVTEHGTYRNTDPINP